MKRFQGQVKYSYPNESVLLLFFIIFNPRGRGWGGGATSHGL